jgi:hypothetical protein
VRCFSKKRWSVGALLAGCVVAACSSGDDSGHDTGQDGASSNAGQNGGGAGGDSGSGAGGDSGSGGGASGMDGAGTGGTGAEVERIPLPGDSRIHGDVLNLVDAEAEAQLIEILASRVQDLELPAQRFYEVFPDEYDFLFFLTDRETEGSMAAAVHDTVRREAIPGTGITGHEPMLEYYSAERLKSVFGVQRSPGLFPPLAHELAHRWANHLDTSLGFGLEGQDPVGSHWGMTSVFGQLGGFDASTVRCETPAGAMPPGCTPLGSGRSRYVVGYFDTYTNSSQQVPYAPLELYLMGLAPLGEVPESFMVLTDGVIDPDSYADADVVNLIVEASGIGEILMADVVATHGERMPAPEAERHFTSAFVVVTATPASDEVMAEVDEWAAIFGGRMTHPTWWSFAKHTGDRATLDTRLGSPRAIDDPFVIPTPTQCDLLLQDCEADMGCYFGTAATCTAAGSLAAGEPCAFDGECAPGNACSLGVGADRLCAPYCDPFDAGSAQACATLCPDAFVDLADEDGVDVGAFCLAGAGGACEPLDPQCDPGSACYGTDAPTCGAAGSTAEGETCIPPITQCVAGTTCVSVQGADSSTCQPYCDPAASASGETACATSCPGRFWTYDGFGVCIPEGV